MSNRNLKKQTSGNHMSSLYKKMWAALNNSGVFGQVALPADSQALSIKGETDISVERESEGSGVVTNGRVDVDPIPMKAKSKVTISTHLHTSGDATKESGLTTFLEAILGKKTTIAADKGASVKLSDPMDNQLAGMTITTAGTLLGQAGNYATMKIINGGSTGTATLTKTGAAFTLTIFNNTSVEDVILLIDSHADLVCVQDNLLDPTSTMMTDLMASRGVVSGDTLYFFGGAAAGYTYDNSEAPKRDMTIIINNEKSGQIVPGVVMDKMTIEFGDKLPTMKMEGQGRHAVLTGVANLSIAASASTRLYVGSDVKQFKYDEAAHSYIDVVAQDGISKKSKANKVMGTGTDGTGSYVDVLTPVTALVGDYVAYHEPDNHNPQFNPTNGQNGIVLIDGVEFNEIRNCKVEYANNHELFENFALEESLAGFDPSKMVAGKFSVEVLVKKQHIDLINRLRSDEKFSVPVEIRCGKSTGSKVVVFMRSVHFNSTNLSSKADSAQTISLEGTMVTQFENVSEASFVLSMC